MTKAAGIFIVVYPSGGFRCTTLDASEAADLAFEVRGLYGELTNIQDFREATERDLRDVVPPEIADEIEAALADPTRLKKRPLRRDDS